MQKIKPEEKVSKKQIIGTILAAVLLVLGGAGAGYYFVMRGSAAEQFNANHQQSHLQIAETNSKQPVVAQDFIYFDLTQPMIVNFPKGSGARFLQISVSFLADSKAAASLKKHEPMVRNNLMMKINAQNPEELKTKVGKEALRALLLEEVNQIMLKMAAGGRVGEVFYTAFVMQ
ncbi:MAG: flagellar basal body protein FliL [Methylococcaceae bacterium]|nr:flagellar basal body protein FliL [Methylococcaceae bacterium]